MRRVLLVEDNAADAERIARFLRRRADLALRIAATGAEALETLARERFVYVLLDYRLPDTNGLELLQTIRRRFPEVQVIFLTGYDDGRLFVGASQLGVIAAISKDHVSERLLGRLLREEAPPAGAPPERTIVPQSLPPDEVYRTLIETMNEGVIVADPEQIIIFVNPRMGEIAGCPAADLLGRGLASLLTPGVLPLFLEEWGRTLSGETRRYECEIGVSGNRAVAVLVSQTPSRRREGEAFGGLLVITDISRQKVIEKRLERLSITDGLTEIFNRRHFGRLLEIEFVKARRHGLPLSCLMIDLDHFKECNDTRGHLFGDEVLRATAQIIRKEIREDDILARYGGEEYILLLPSISLTGAAEVGERIRASIARRPFSQEGREHRMTGSVGVASVEDPRVDTPEALVRLADRALYRAKVDGRNRVSIERP